MKGYLYMTEAVEEASKVTGRFISCDSGEEFSTEELKDAAKIADITSPVMEGMFYVVFPDGEIGIMEPAEKEIYELFKPAASEKAPRFCVNCGAKLGDNEKFCTSCGSKIGGV